MDIKQISTYIGYYKILFPNESIDAVPSMYLIMDEMKKEADLIILTPGALNRAYKYLLNLDAINIRLFVPSLRPEFISDIFNLYMSLVYIKPIMWVFPDKPFYPHIDFESGQIKQLNYINDHDSSISISYIKNENVDDVYDIIVRDNVSTR